MSSQKLWIVQVSLCPGQRMIQRKHFTALLPNSHFAEVATRCLQATQRRLTEAIETNKHAPT
jgi:hypothetical protein